MKFSSVSAVCLLVSCITVSAHADELSLDARRMLSYGTTAVMVKVCNLPITAAENTQMMTALAKYGDAQKDLSQEAFTESMKTAGAQIAANKDAICAQLATAKVADMLAEAEDGK